ncbi:MAG: MATE family efflux transporter [Candidatus Schekmanbacteria bacterium]|nr:MATE family efflux transporter [Candidatus Schekmanbacteria bacterium]
MRRTAQTSLLRMTVPLVVSFWMRSLFTFVDTIYASTIGDAAVAAIGYTLPFEFCFIAAWVGLSTALTSHLSRAMGSADHQWFDRLTRATGKLAAAVIPVFCLVAVGIFAWADRLGLAPEVAENFRIYGTVIVGGSALVAFWSVIPDSVVKAHHDTRATMVAGIISNVINLALNTVFLFLCGWGIFGIALSTVLGRFGGLAYASWRAVGLERSRRASDGPLSPRAATAAVGRSPEGMLLKLALPASVAYMLMAAEGGLVNALLAHTPDATAAIAAYSIFYRILMLSTMPLIATTVAMLPFVARHLGDGNVALVRRSYAQAMWGGAAYIVAVVAPASYFGAGPLVAWLAESPATAAYGISALRLLPLVALVTIPFTLSRPVFEGFQRGQPTAMMAIFRFLILAPPLYYGGLRLGEQWGFGALPGLIFGIFLASVVTSAVFLWWTLRFLHQEIARAPEVPAGAALVVEPARS